MGILLEMDLTPLQFKVIGIIALAIFMFLWYVGPPPYHDEEDEDDCFYY